MSQRKVKVPKWEIYKITCLESGKIYVGSTTRGHRVRWSQHVEKLSSGAHHSKHLQNAWNQYGKDSFVIECLEELPITELKDLVFKEQYYLDFYKSWDHEKGYNNCKVAYSTSGLRMPESFRLNQSKARSKLLDEEIIVVLKSYWLDKKSLKKIATEMNVAESTVRSTALGRTINTRSFFESFVKTHDVRIGSNGGRVKGAQKGRDKIPEEERLRKAISSCKFSQEELEKFMHRYWVGRERAVLLAKEAGYTHSRLVKMVTGKVPCSQELYKTFMTKYGLNPKAKRSKQNGNV